MKRGFTLAEILVLVGIIGILILALAPAFVNVTKTGRGLWNRQMYGVQKVDDATRYSTLRDVEDTCRTMQASYAADVGAYKAYVAAGQADIAVQVLIRANRTATTYNEFVRKNSYVWKGAIPADIDVDLPLVMQVGVLEK